MNLRSTPSWLYGRDAELFPGLDAARRAHRTPLRYRVAVRPRVVEIMLDGFFVPDDVATRLASLYQGYVDSWAAASSSRWPPGGWLWLPGFADFVHLVVLRADAKEWIALLDAAAPLTFNLWDRCWRAA